MTYSSSGPERVMAVPDVDPPPQSSSSNSSSSSSSSTSSHSHSHSHSHSNQHPPHVRSLHGKRHTHAHRSADEEDIVERNIDSGKSQDSSLDLEIRQDTSELTGYITHVVQTVSLVQVVDYTGSPIATETRYGTPNTIVVDSASGATVSVSNPDSSDDAQDSSDMTSVNASTPSVDTSASSSDANGYLIPTQDSASVVATPAASTYSLNYDSLDAASTPGAHNATSATTNYSTPVSSQTTLTDSSSIPTSSATTEASSSSVDNSIQMQMFSTPSSTTTTSTTQSSSSSISSTTWTTSSTTSTSTTSTTSDLSSTTLSSTIYSYSTETWTSTQYADDAGSGGGYGDATAVNQPSDPTTTSEASESSGGSLSKQQKQVIGGVVGSIAGVAFLALLILLALRHKKRHGRHALLGEGPAETRSRGLITSGSGSGGAMTERSGPFAAAAAMAGLASKRTTQTSDPAPTGERGFYRVSGKKLPSVLHSGGDGFTDPREMNRESVASGTTDYWRGSQAFEPQGGSAMLALGSPMRPVSGVPVIRTGPARTPVTEENPFADPVPRPRPDSDALGDSICAGSRTSQDTTWPSPSRFQERI